MVNLQPVPPDPYPFPYSADRSWTVPIDPDQPAWGPGSGLLMWGISILAIVLLQLPAAMLWAGEIYMRTGKMPVLSPNVQDPRLVLYSVLSTIVAHLITFTACWMLVRTSAPNVKFWNALGWGWTKDFRWYHCWGIILSFLALGVAVSQLIPHKETDFDRILKIGPSIRIAVSIVALATAPLVEEVVYRGMLYSGFRKMVEPWAAITLVSFLFLLVHVPQYWGGWDGLTVLALLSITLTIVRARTRSLLPCIYIHTIFNGIGVASILMGGR